jgi:hypothetical protein|tara:strand:+ start:498 stop:884 length:387 start_codon:yes stop_codon:yes gene_type:complete
MKLKLKLELTYETFENIIVTALEGGSNYWYMLGDTKGIPKRDDMPNEAPSQRIAYGLWHNKDSELPIWDLEEEDELLGTLTYDSVREGMQIACDNYLEEINMMIGEDYDAWTADTLFQVLVMGEVTFG